MKSRTIGTLVIILVVLGSIYYFDYRRTVERESAELEQSRLVPLTADEIDGMTIRNTFGKFELEKRKNIWWLTQPIADQADQTVVRGQMLADLDKAERSNPFEVSTSAARGKGTGRAASTRSGSEGEEISYGLDKPTATVVLRSSSQGRGVELAFGAETPVTGECYVADRSKPNLVYTTPSKIKGIFSQDLAKLRDKTVLAFDSERVSSFWIRRSSDTVGGRKEGEEWTLDLGGGTSGTLRSLGDGPIIERMLRKVQSAQVAAFVTRDVLNLSTFGLDQPQITLELREEPTTTTATREAAGINPTTAAHLLSIGKHAPTTAASKPLYFAMRRGRNSVFTIGGDVVSVLAQPPAAYRDRRVFSFRHDEVAYLQIEAVTSVAAFSRDAKGQWRFAADPTKPLDADKVKDYIAYCLNLRIEEYPDPPITEPEDARLDKPVLRVTMATGDRAIRQGFEVGGAPKGQPFFYARRSPGADRSGESEIFLLGLPLTGFYALMRTPDFFVYKRLLSFDAEAVARIKVESRQSKEQPSSLVLTRDEKGTSATWHVTLERAGKSGTIPEYQVGVLLEALRAIDYIAPVKDVTDEVRKLEALDSPPVTIQVLDAEGKSLGAISFGDLSRGERAMVVTGEQKYFLVETKSFSGVGRAIDEIIAKLGD